MATAGAWDTGLCDCFSDCKVFLVSWFCAPCQIAQQIATVEGRECSAGLTIASCFFSLCCAIKARRLVREKYGIVGSGGSDCCTVFCCGLCAISQQTRQIRLRGDKPGGMFMEP